MKFSRKITTYTKTLVLLAGLAVVLLGSMIARSGTAHADINHTRADAWGTLELAGSGWLNGGGVNVYSNGSQVTYTPNKPNNTVNGVVSGEEWQCVEMVNRLYLTKGWTTATWKGYGNTLINNIPNGLTKQNNGSVSYVNPGDVITLDDGGIGHAGIINTIDSNGTIHIVNQNAIQVYSSAYIDSGSLSKGNAHYHMNGWSKYKVQAIIHHPTGGGSVPKPGDCNGDGHVDAIDLSILLSHINQAYGPCDFNHDGIVNIYDLSILESNYGT